MINQSAKHRAGAVATVAAAEATSAVGAKTARACDNCLRRRARWYCTADDAFLCQSCDSSVHSANPLARRHHRVRLKTASGASSSPAQSPALISRDPTPAWLHGLKRKARTPRGKPGLVGALGAAKVETRVPDLEAIAAEECRDSEEEQLLYCVPIFDPDLAEFRCPPLNDVNVSYEEAKPPAQLPEYCDATFNGDNGAATDGLAGFHPSDMDLAEFAADMETLLGRGLDNNDSPYISGLGLIDTAADKYENKNKVKPELDDLDIRASDVDSAEACGLDMETFHLDFGCGSPTILAGEIEKAASDAAAVVSESFEVRKLILNLDYEAVIASWSLKGCSPWTDGHRPQVNPGDCLPGFLGTWGDGGGELQRAFVGQMAGVGDGGRKAKVTRYREKRRTRLFSKKIRYEVRKLNAEKRPRMKGRFVKRAAAALPAAAAAGALGPLSFAY